MSPVFSDLFGPPPVADEDDDDIFGSKGKFGKGKGLFDDDSDDQVQLWKTCIVIKLLQFLHKQLINHYMKNCQNFSKEKFQLVSL